MKPEDKDEKEYLREIAPTLFGKAKPKEALPPDGYFDSFAEYLMAQIRPEKPKGKLLQMVNYRNLSIAAGLAVLLAMVPVVRHFMAPDGNEEEAAIAEITLPESIDADFLATYLDEELLASEIESEEVDDWYLDASITDAEVVDYLMEENFYENDILVNL